MPCDNTRMAVSMAAALHTLRTSVRSTLPVKPEFVARHHPLTAAETDLKRSLGAPMDLTLSLNR